MRYLIDGAALSSGRGGDETMLRGVLRGLALTTRPDDRVTVLADCLDGQGLPDDTGRGVRLVPMARRPGAVHFGAQLPWYLTRHGGEHDVVFTVTHAPLRSPVPVALMVQDLSFLHLPEDYPPRTRHRLRLLVGAQVRRAAVVLTVSEFSRQDLVRSYGLRPDRVHVVPNTVERLVPLAPDRKEGVLAALADRGVVGPFLLYLGNLHPRKNVPRTIRAFAEARRTDPGLSHHRLVVGGSRWWGTGEHEAAATAPEGSVVFLGRVDEDTRQVLLETADALLYVSRFEGFGLPPLEAMAASTPVLAGDAAAIPEVTGGAALLVDPGDDRAIVEGIRRIVADDELRCRLVESGHARVDHFRAETTGAAVRDALDAALPVATAS